MQIKIFNIPIGADESLTEEMNHFLRANKIVDLKRDLAMLNGNSCWTFCVTYSLAARPMDGENGRVGNSSKVDYREILDPETFTRFSDFRKVRKQIAESEAIPAYAVFTDAELSEMAKLDSLTMETLSKISGIGKKKLEKYGLLFVQSQSTSESNEAGGTLDGADSQP